MWAHSTFRAGGGASGRSLTHLSLAFRCGYHIYQRVLVVKRTSPGQVEENGFSQRLVPQKHALASAAPTTDILVIHSKFVTLESQSA